MSSQASQVSIASANAGDAVLVNYLMQVVGSRFETTPTVVANGQIRGIQIASDGTVIVKDAAVLAELLLIHAQLDDMELDLETIQTLITATNTKLDAANTNLGTINTSVGAVKTSTDAVKTSVDAVKTSTDTVKTATDAVAAKIPALGQAAKAASLPVVLASDQGNLSIANSILNLTTVGVSALNGDVVASVDVSAYTAVSFQLTGTWVGTVTFQGSNDNTNFVSVSAIPVSVATTAPVQTATAVGGYLIPVQAKFIRIRVTAYTSGTVAGAGFAYTNAPQDVGGRNVSVQGTAAVTQSGTWTVQPGNTANTTPWLVAQKGRTQSNAPVYNAYGTTAVTTAAYTQIVASTTAATTWVDIFDSSGQAMILATGAAAAETILAYIPPGGLSTSLTIAAGTRVTLKALTANASSGYVLVNFWG